MVSNMFSKCVSKFVDGGSCDVACLEARSCSRRKFMGRAHVAPAVACDSEATSLAWLPGNGRNRNTLFSKVDNFETSIKDTLSDLVLLHCC
jgi:hypothetical protein